MVWCVASFLECRRLVIGLTRQHHPCRTIYFGVGLFTRRLAATNKYGRVLGCDYSESMLTEARRRIRADPKLSSSSLKTRLDLVRLDVGQIPMQTESVDCLHAGAAMHCWPDLDAAVKEIYRVLKPGGRYFATTFLSLYFSNVQAAEGGGGSVPNPSTQAFQYFESVNTLRSLLEAGGFAPEKIFIEVLGAACVVIRCEK
jgi:ubiquinone/menaquinone biosynthesis C-methylase UbiE